MPHNNATKRIFSADAIRSKEIIGVDANFTNVSGTVFVGQSISGQNIRGDTISGRLVIGETISGETVDGDLGNFDELYVGGVKHIPKINFLYAFRFGGGLTKVPSSLPKKDLTNYYTGLLNNDDKVFVEDTGLFKTGDHVVINPYGISGHTVDYQEEATVISIYDYSPTDCCDTKSLSSFPSGSSSIYFDYTLLSLSSGDKIYISGQPRTYTVLSVTESLPPAINAEAIINPSLSADLNSNTCICLTKPALQIDRGLYHDYPTGTIIANKFGGTTEIPTGVFNGNSGLNCYSKCYNADHLYLEIGSGLQYYNGQVYNEEGMTWEASGYRENFIGYSGIEVHITGINEYGLLTLIYPKE